MRVLISLTICALLAAALAGCEITERHQREVNTQIMQSVSDRAIQNAIVAQQTIYPYHFVADGPSLNDLGRCELAVLAAHYREHPGMLNVRQGSTPPDLYQARVKAVSDALAEAGVPAERVRIADDMPGGAGMSSQHVLKVIEGRNSPSQPLYYGGGGGGGSAQAGGGEAGGGSTNGGGGQGK